MLSPRARYIALVITLTAVELVTPYFLYGWLFARAHGPGVEINFDRACWQTTVQLVSWLIGCLAVIGVAGCGYEWLRPRGGWLVKANLCRNCGHWLTSEDLYCPACATTTAEWELPSPMLSEHARDFARKVADADSGVPADVLEAARFLVTQARPVSPEAAAALETFCLGNATLQRRLYFAAALRLHPDRNNGELRTEWQHLQLAVKTLRDHLKASASSV